MDSESKKKEATRQSVKADKTVHKDATWKDAVKYEKHIAERWHKKWDFLLMPENRPKIRNEEIDKKLEAQGRNIGLIAYQRYEKREIALHPSPPIPIKSSGHIGWRSSSLENSFNLYVTKPPPYKICFKDEEYGRYRVIKYLQTKSKEEPEQLKLPSKFIRHIVNPLLC